MKKLVWLIVILGLFFIGLPGLLGFTAEREATKQLEINKNNPLVGIRISNYERGWFTSDVRYEVAFSDEYLQIIERSAEGADPDKPGELDDLARAMNEPFELVSTITHGPAGFQDGFFFGLFRAQTTDGPNNPDVKKFLNEIQMPYLFKGNSTTSFTGNTSFEIEVPPIDVTPSGADSDVERLTFTGMNLSGNYNGKDAIQFNGNSANLAFESAKSHIMLNGLEFDADSKAITDKLWLGPASIKIKGLSASTLQGDALERLDLTELAFSLLSDHNTANNTIDIQFSYSLADALFDGQQFSDLELTMGLDSLSISAVEKYTALSEELVLMDEKEQEQKLLEMMPLVHEFAASSPKLRINPIKGSAAGETIEASLNISIDGSNMPGPDNFNVADLSLWQRITTGAAGLEISEALATTMAIATTRNQIMEAVGDQGDIPAEQITQMAALQAPIYIETLIQQGMIERKDGKLRGSVQFEQGELMLNGAPIPVAGLLGI